MAKQSLYDVLGVSPKASQKEIQKAYRQKAQKLHPDHAGGDPAAFNAVAKAYKVLSKPEARERYDETGCDTEPRSEGKMSNAEEAMCSLFLGVMQETSEDKVLTTDLIEKCVKRVSGNRDRLKNDLKWKKKQIATLKKAASKVGLKRGRKGDNLLAMIVMAQINNLTRGVEACEDSIQLQKELLELLDAYKYDADKPKEWQPTFGVRTGGSLFNSPPTS